MSPYVEPGRGYLGCSAPGRGAAAQQLLARQLVGEHQAAMAAGGGTIFFPDVSNYQAGLTIQPATAALLAKSTEGQTFVDGSYAGFKAQAGRVSAVFGAYHFLWGGTAAEAQHVHQVVGSTPLMLDVENTNVRLRLDDVAAFVRNYRLAGGVVHLAYLPRWYWAGTMGSPSLVPLQQLGVSVVSSNYTSYSDAGAGWARYGGITPVQWQYTDALPYGGQAVDFNAFKGSAAQYRALLTGSTPAPATVSEDDMITYVQEMKVAGHPEKGLYPAVWKLEAGFLDWLSAHDLDGSRSWAVSRWKNAFDAGNVQHINPGDLGCFGALRPGTAVPPAGQWSGAPLRGYAPTAA
jgi:hypothetical protein